jgi:predicted TIM-barrel fold metal-dependent hydrolase
MRIDGNAFVGAYPYRRVPGTSPEALLAAVDRVGIDEAWVSHLPGIFWRDPTEGNEWLIEMVSRHRGLRSILAVHPGLAHWEEIVQQAQEAGAPAVRCDPTFYDIDPSGSAMQTLTRACGEVGIPLMLAVRLEDGRQRHPNDGSAELSAAAVRTLVRSAPDVRLIITHADRSFIEEVHFGSTPAEATRIWWDICWIWGPPEDHLQVLLQTIGPERFLFGTGQPLRIPENAVAKLDLVELSGEERQAIEAGNALKVTESQRHKVTTL